MNVDSFEMSLTEKHHVCNVNEDHIVICNKIKTTPWQGVSSHEQNIDSVAP